MIMMSLMLIQLKHRLTKKDMYCTLNYELLCFGCSQHKFNIYFDPALENFFWRVFIVYVSFKKFLRFILCIVNIKFKKNHGSLGQVKFWISI